MARISFMYRWVAIVLLCGWGMPTLAAEASDDELKAIGMKAQDAIRALKPDVFGALWNNAVTIDRITGNIDMPAAMKKGFLEGMGNDVGKALGDAVIKSVGKTGSYTYLGIKTIDGKRGPVLRLMCDQGLNFHQLIIEPDGNGKPQVVDIYIVLSGEPIVQTQRRMYLMLANMGPKKEKADPNLEAFVNFIEKMQKGDFQGVLDSYDALPDKLKRERAISLYRVMAAGRLGKDDVYIAALTDYAKLRKEDATVDLLSIDLLLKKKDYDGSMKALDSLEKKMGEDGAIDFNRANVKATAGDDKAALEYATKAVEKDQTLFAAADYCATVALKSGDFALAKKYLLLIEMNHANFRFGDLKGVALFKEFVKSPEYGQWQKERPQK